MNRRPLSNVRRTSDILFPRLRLAVYVDGCFWHGCPQHHTVAKTNAVFWAAKVEANRRRDIETRSQVEAAGWTVIQVWEHDDPLEAADRIETLVRGATAVPKPNGTPHCTA